MGNACERVSVCCAMVRNWRPRDYKSKLRVSNAISVPHIHKEYRIYPLDDARADPSDGALDSLVARRAHHQSAARINRRQQRVAILQAMLEVFASLKSPRDYPSQLAFLERYQHSCVSTPRLPCLAQLARAIKLPTWASATFMLSSPGDTGGQMSRDMAVQRWAKWSEPGIQAAIPLRRGQFRGCWSWETKRL